MQIAINTDLPRMVSNIISIDEQVVSEAQLSRFFFCFEEDIDISVETSITRLFHLKRGIFDNCNKMTTSN